MGMIRIPQFDIPYDHSTNVVNNYDWFSGSAVQTSGTDTYCSTNAVLPTQPALAYGCMAGRGGISFYSGTMPTQAQIDTAIPLTSASSITDPYAASRLVSFTAASCMLAKRNLTIVLNQGTASASGTATWFMLFIQTYSSPTYYPAALVGSITALGGGGDIEVVTNTFVSTSIYKVPQFTLTLPVRYSF